MFSKIAIIILVFEVNNNYYALTPVQCFVSGIISDSADSTTTSSISLPTDVFINTTAAEAGIVFTYYNTSVLFPLRISDQNVSEMSAYKAIGSPVIAATVAGQNVTNLQEPITVNSYIYMEVSRF